MGKMNEKYFYKMCLGAAVLFIHNHPLAALLLQLINQNQGFQILKDSKLFPNM